MGNFREVQSLTIDSLFQTKIMGVDQILQFRPNFTILEYFEYLELGQFRNFCDVLTPVLPPKLFESAAAHSQSKINIFVISNN